MGPGCSGGVGLRGAAWLYASVGESFGRAVGLRCSGDDSFRCVVWLKCRYSVGLRGVMWLRCSGGAVFSDRGLKGAEGREGFKPLSHFFSIFGNFPHGGNMLYT